MKAYVELQWAKNEIGMMVSSQIRSKFSFRGLKMGLNFPLSIINLLLHQSDNFLQSPFAA